MRFLPICLGLAGALTPAAAMARAAPADLGTITLDRRDPVLAAIVAGVPARLAVSFDPPASLSAAFASRLPVDWQDGGTEEVGRVTVAIREAAGEVSFALAPGTAPAAMRLQTQAGPCCRGHDGAIGATRLPWSTVRIGPAGALPERRFPATLDDESGLSIPWRVGGETIHLLLAPDAAETVATASAAAILSNTYGGHLAAPVRAVPIAYGIARSVRDMAFDRPVPVLGFTLGRVAVRVADFAGRTRLPAEPAAPGGDAGDAIVVRHRRLPPQHRWAAIMLGRDLLDRCPALTVYTRSGEIGLACAPG